MSLLFTNIRHLAIFILADSFVLVMYLAYVSSMKKRHNKKHIIHNGIVIFLFILHLVL